jgi:hypothetical protein
MSEPASDQPVKITAKERAHPAIRTLARACIALARSLSGTMPQPPASPDQPPVEGAAAVSAEEQPHG